MKLQTIVGLFVIILSVVFVSHLSGGDNKNRNEALHSLSQWKKSQKWHERFSVQVATTFRTIAPVNELEPSGRVEATIKKLGSCLNISGFSYHLAPKMAEHSQKFQTIVNKKVGMNLGHEIKKQPKAANVTEKPGRMLNRDLADISMGPALDGYVLESDGKCLADIMSEADDLAFLGTELINGYPCQKISSKTKYGSVELWLDEKNGYLPRQYVFKRGSDDLCSEGRRLRESNMYGAGEGDLKGVFLNSWSCVLDQVEVSKEFGFFFPIKGRLITNLSRSDGKKGSGEKIYNRIKFNPAPNLSEDDFKIDLPNGMQINNQDDPNSGVIYEWRDGKVAVAYSDFSNSAEGKWPGRSLLLVLFWLVIGVALLSVFLRYIWRYKKAGR